MTYSIEYTNKSIDDLINIYNYIAYETNEIINAKNLICKIKSEINLLKVFPYRFPVVSFSPFKDINMRYFCVKKHIIFYLINEKNTTINIIRILSSKQNIENITL